MILEGLVTTLDREARLNVAPMGPIVDESLSWLRLRPFRSSRTYANLKAQPCGVFHIVDDVLLLARAAIGRLDEPVETFAAERVAGRVVAAACRWYEFEIDACDDSGERAEMRARVVHTGRLRDVFGFNRARHMVLEAAILATRVQILPREEILAELSRLRVPVEKTAGPREREAFALLEEYIAEQLRDANAANKAQQQQAGEDSEYESGVLAANGPASGGVNPRRLPDRRDQPGGSLVSNRETSEQSASRTPQAGPTRATAAQHVTISTGARLHCGLFAPGAGPGRRLGGVGVMIDRPGFVVRVTRSDENEFHAPDAWRDRLVGLVRTCRERALAEYRPPPCLIEILAAPPAHAGFGSGTQLGLAVAQALATVAGETGISAIELARRAKRGLRSAVGLYGFVQGGLLVEGGKRTPEAISPLVARAEFPQDWRFVLVRPRESAGLSGEEEAQGLARLSAMPEATTDRLCRLTLLELLPAVVEQRCDEAGEALYEIGRGVGEYFAPLQGGVYADATMRDLAADLRRRGHHGIGQTSWGPTLFVLCREADEATQLADELTREPRLAHFEVSVASPLNRGATVTLE